MVPADYSDWRQVELKKKNSRRRCCSIRCLKAPMHMFTFFYWLSGVALVIIGAWTLLFENDYSVLLGSSWFLIIVGLMIGTGGLIVIVCICGCYGIVKEHRYFLVSFLIMLTLIFIIQCSMGVVAFINRAQIEGDLDRTIIDRMNEYGSVDDVKKSFDRLQQRGCISRLTEYFRDRLFILGMILVLLSAFQLTGIVLSSCMVRLVEYY